jgi:phospholipase/carboxylesterase
VALKRLAYFASALLLVGSLALVREPSKRAAAPIVGPWRTDVRAVGALEYLLVEPARADRDAVLPTIVYLHGRGARARVPDPAVYDLSTPVRILVPRAPDAFGAGYAWMPVSAAHGESAPLLEALDERGALLASAISVWRRRHPMPDAPIVVGFSQGGMMALELALHHPAAVSRAIAMGSWYPPSRVAPRVIAPPLTILHGADDSVLAAERTRALASLLEQRGAPVAIELFDGIGHEVPPPMAARLRALLEEAVRCVRHDPSA